ncbi:MAG: branched chain amino acid aminotransferase apoenzyme, partial [Armatimonadetes bacterium]|nr:branched chain amino acid aminotransferase apoenzyme [Armatimonadota bacterium]
MSPVIYLDGQYLPKDEAKISVFDHGFLYGDGVFEGIRAYNGRVFRLDEHVERLYRSAKAIMLNIPCTEGEMREAVLETCRRNNLANGYLRVVVSRGPGDLGIDPRNCHGNATVVIIADKLTMYPQSMYDNGMAVITTATRRNSPAALDPNIKSLNYLNNILAKIEVNRAARAGGEVPVGEGLMLNLDGYVAEATGDNIFVVTGGTLVTPPTYVGILEGITRNCVLELARQLGIPAEERVFTMTTVYGATEIFLTGTGAEVIPVVRVDDRQIADGRPGPITRQLITAFRQLVNSQGVEIGLAEP